jgi:hypothetical protein
MHQRLGGTHCLHPRDGEYDAAVSFHTLVPNWQTRWHHIPSHPLGNLEYHGNIFSGSERGKELPDYVRHYQLTKNHSLQRSWVGNQNLENTFRAVQSSKRARGSVVGWGTVLQAGRSQVWYLLWSLDFSVDIILPVALWPWGRLSLLREMSTRNLPGGKGRPARKADLTAICEMTV